MILYIVLAVVGLAISRWLRCLLTTPSEKRDLNVFVVMYNFVLMLLHEDIAMRDTYLFLYHWPEISERYPAITWLAFMFLFIHLYGIVAKNNVRCFPGMRTKGQSI
ncbi:hypothetical protein [Pseudomonas entomophila]|uniref:Uncharacterized protein n=1 Tax=Pseudomonas entomophila TaxID=312306 RepID=A0ABY9QKK6_9PSED|nr:hypothetical protein [Pseudomonas entomophila]WMW04264.1 hypothetical protein RAH46_18240 [Pseudomonas entomophila]